VVLTWAMRGTLHFVAAEDFGWLVGMVLEPHASTSRRRLGQMGVGTDLTDRGVRTIERMLARSGPLTRRELTDALRRVGIPTGGQIIPHLTWLAASRGSICFGPERDGERCYVLVRDWLGSPEPMDRDRALAELATRYLRAHGPATAADLAFWSGVRATDAKRGWRSIQDRLTPIAGPDGPAWMLKSRRPADVPVAPVRLLPSFDEYLLGWRDRRFIADAAGWRRIFPGGGWFHPSVIADGRAVGTWKLERSSPHAVVEVRPFSGLGPAVRRAIAAEARDVGTYLGTEAATTFA
jgi:Winged helix DNA-binding domain